MTDSFQKIQYKVQKTKYEAHEHKKIQAKNGF